MNLPQCSIAVVWGPTDAVASKKAVGWALEQFTQSLKQGAVVVYELEGTGRLPKQQLCVLVCDPHSDAAQAIARQTGAELPAAPESFAMMRGTWDGSSCLLVTGADTRGFVYALLELADRVKHSADPLAQLQQIAQLADAPTMPVRSVKRLFSSEIEDKPWFYDKTFWREYLTELAAHRFNRFNLALGMAIDHGHDPNLKDNYFCFAYPFFVDVSGYDVHVRRLPDEERRRNLEMLQFIGSECSRRGIHFQLGLWIHDYLMGDCPDQNYVVEGVSAGNHAPYCRDALAVLLQSCPDIGGVTLRVHYECGIPEPAHEFWQVVFEKIPHIGRPVEIDLHAKGLYDEMMQVALDTGMPVMITAKYHAEHTALPYHQAAIREMERVIGGSTSGRSRTTGDRRYTRYGYADFLKKDRPYKFMFRIWPGSQRLLLWGDPALAAGYGRCGTFGGSEGIEVMEPLTFKGRKDSGNPGGRDPYADAALRFGPNEEWKKYKYYYRVWGRSLFNPDGDPEAWRRYLRSEFGEAAEHCEQSLAHASRILPLFTSAHLPSAAQAVNWTEMQTNMTLSTEGTPTPYRDTPDPKTFGTVSPIDPAMFYGINEYARDLAQGKRKGKYSPVFVANSLDALADAAERHWREAAAKANDPQSAAFRRLAADIAAQIGLGRFYARKFRAALAYALFEESGEQTMLALAIAYYNDAKAAWESIVGATKQVYRHDLTFGSRKAMRGHWAERVADIAEDIALLERQYRGLGASDSYREPGMGEIAATGAGIDLFADHSAMIRPRYEHTPPPTFGRGDRVELQLSLPETAGETQVRLHYRRMNQAEAYEIAEMEQIGSGYRAAIPAHYTDSPYALIYFFELRNSSGEACFVPGLNAEFSNEPYYVVPQQ